MLQKKLLFRIPTCWVTKEVLVKIALAQLKLLQKGKRNESIAKSSIFIRECRVNPDSLVVLASDHQLEELVQFRSDPQEFSIFCADPTFSIFENNINLTVTISRNLKLENKATNQPLCLLVHY